MPRIPKEVSDAAQLVLDWHDSLDDPRAIAIAHAQGKEAADKALLAGGGIEAAQMALIRRHLESIARDNAGLIDKLTGKAG